MSNTFAALEVGYGKVRDVFGGMGRFKGGLRCNGWVNSVVIHLITEINYRCNCMQVFFKYKYNVKNMYANIKCIVSNY